MRRAANFQELCYCIEELLAFPHEKEYMIAFKRNHSPVIFATVLRFALSAAPITLFYFFLLYAAGVIVNHLLGIPEIEGKAKRREDEDEELDDEDDEE